MHSCKNEVIVITGAAAGIGRATVREFARHGASIGLIARGHDGLDAARREVEEAGGRALVVPTDVADATAVEAAAAKIEETFGPIDIWINVAFSNVFSPFHELTPDEYKRLTEVSYLGFVYGTLAALKRMRSRNRGTIVQTGSALAYRSIPLQAGYCGAKSAIRGFTDSIRCELVHEKSKVHITMVQMPAVNTPQFSWCKSKLPHKAQPVPPIFQPEVAARALYWAAHHRTRELWVGGSTVKAILGQKIIPGLLDVYLGKTGYKSQQYDGSRDPDAPINLWEPAPGDYGAHGDFDERSREFSRELWLATHGMWAVYAATAVLALGTIALARKIA
ncbi:MAG: SDR family oxidoreductase [Candidatus Eremiobacteraeota bacterium]|nr:SDR family oxidoreductase [Candidatus Eremiobacteraeota bacterium]MBC5804562.1 SDR family oxidoreductase [Candidatus Eremiobacteraeota bacterium]MBC5821960.1 SDR family oxidoreductase [Candidatus Eremiobacteraeota bacterium]